MNVKKYQTIIKQTAIYPKEIGLAYCALGLTGEAGEVADKVKKLYRDGLGTTSASDTSRDFHLMKDEDPDVQAWVKSVGKELGDTLWYITAMANELGLTLEEIMQTNYDKLIKRRETNTLSGSGDDREEG